MKGMKPQNSQLFAHMVRSKYFIGLRTPCRHGVFLNGKPVMFVVGECTEVREHIANSFKNVTHTKEARRIESEIDATTISADGSLEGKDLSYTAAQFAV